MALVNYSLPFGAVNVNAPPAWATITPIHASPHAVNNLYEPSSARNSDDNYYKNGPYRHHHPSSLQQQQQQQHPQQTQSSRNYLPPPLQQQQNHQNSNNNRNGYPQNTATRTRTYGENSYSQQQPPLSFSSLSQSTGFYSSQQQSFKENPFQIQKQQQQQSPTTKAPPSKSTISSYQTSSNMNSNKNFQQTNLNQGTYPHQPSPGFKSIQAGHGTRTQNGINCMKFTDLRKR